MVPDYSELLQKIREAAGDPTGKLMQDELVEHIAKMQRDAARYQWLRTHTGACYPTIGAPAEFRTAKVRIPKGMNVMKGSVAQHFDAAIDAVMAGSSIGGVKTSAPTGWDKWLRADHIKLHAREMSAQELRTVQAVVRAMLAEAAAGVKESGNG